MPKGFLLFSLSLFVFFSADQTPCFIPKKKAKKQLAATQNIRNQRNRILTIKDILLKYPNYMEALEALLKFRQNKLNAAEGVTGYQQQLNRRNEILLRMIKTCPSYKNYFASMKMANHYFGNRKFKLAEGLYNSILNSPDADTSYHRIAKNKLEKIKTYFDLINNPITFKPTKVNGPSSSDKEYLPMLSPDNRYLFFTRNMQTNPRSTFQTNKKDMFLISRKIGDNKFSSGLPMPSPFNESQFQGGVSVSIDNSLLFVTIVNYIPYPCTKKVNRSIVLSEGKNPGFDNADIFYSENINNQWTPLKSIGDHINTACTWESMPSISADGKTLFFTRCEEPKNFGDLDIFKVERQPDGSWGEPINLGYPINTSGDEKAPFLHSDSQTLYFSSNGHMGIGGYDVFFSKKDKKTGNMGIPKNLGYPINTEKDEHGFIISRDGETAYYSSSLEGEKTLNLYSFKLPKTAQPEKVTFIEGQLTDVVSDTLLNTEVNIYNTKTEEHITGSVNNTTGKYVVAIATKEKEDLILTIKKKGYAFSSQVISPASQKNKAKTYHAKDMKIKPIKKDAVYRINDIEFLTGSYKLLPKTKYILHSFLDFLNLNPSVEIAINGHTDNVGDSKQNLILSQKRAQSVYEYLLKNNIAKKRLSYSGFGAKKPIASNDTKEGRQKNRRTEFQIIKQ